MRDTRYDVNDTIVAVSSPPLGSRVIVRITGPATIETCERIFSPAVASIVHRPSSIAPRLIAGSIAIDNELEVDAHLYLFLAPHSYTGDDVAEIHILAGPAVTAPLMGALLARGLRMAGPGEFTARAYLNGKIDLAQAEAVNEIVVSSNTYQLAAAEKLLSGRLGQTTENLRSQVLDCLSLLEAGLDFSGEDIELVTQEQAVERLAKIREQLEQLLAGSISYESIIDLPAVGIAGAPNAGKSSLLNKLLGKERSIVSDQRKTTRDVLTGQLSLAHFRCVLFDCAGLTQKSEDSPQDALWQRQKPALREAEGTEVLSSDLCPLFSVLDELAQQAAIEALRNSAVVVFCVDISQDPRLKTQDLGLWTEEIGLWSLVCGLGSGAVIPVATKCDLVSEKVLAARLAHLNRLFATDFLGISVKTGIGLERLKDTIDRELLAELEVPRVSGVALTARHRKAVTDAIDNIGESINELKAGNDEFTALMLRAAYQALSDIVQQHIDEQILDRIFSRFCIGK